MFRKEYFIIIGHFVANKQYEDVVSVTSQGSSTSVITIAQDASLDTIDGVMMTHRIDDSLRRVDQQMMTYHEVTDYSIDNTQYN